MKKIKIAGFFLLFTIIFNGCKECFECTKTEFGVTQTEEECDEDLILKLENAGFDCSKKV